MKLLFDNNLSVKLLSVVEEQFPESSHVYQLGLDKASDREIFLFARDNRFTIVTKDKDYYHLLNTLGNPPKIVWLAVGNCSNFELTELLKVNAQRILEFITGKRSMLVIELTVQ